MDFVRLEGIPLPPSINEAYINRRGSSGPGRFKSPKYRTFEAQLFAWKLKHSLMLGEATHLIGPTGWLEVNVEFMLPWSKVITKDGRPKRHDVDNRLKVLNDAVSHLLMFDDCRIAQQRIRKVASKVNVFGHVNVEIRRAEIQVVQ